MPVLLACRCGARFEVEETTAGQQVQCPECHSLLKAPAAARAPQRTSGFAITSVICALLLGLTVVGPVLAVVFGVMALLAIARRPDRLTGAGYAVFGIVGGVVFGGISLLAFTNAELFVGLRTKLLLGKVDTSGPMEVVKPHDGFAITRPTPRWGVAGAEMAHKLASSYALILVEPGKDSYLGVQAEDVRGLTVQEYRDQIIRQFQREAAPNWNQPGDQAGRMQEFHVRLLRKVHPPGPNGAHFTAEEAVLDGRVLGQPLTYLIRFLRETNTGRLFSIRGWCLRRRYEKMEPAFLQAMDSFRAVASER